MITTRLIRFFHTNNHLWQAANKTLLAKLRKKTGYTFSNCRKALDLHENDVEKAEKWLKEQAQALGWTQAVKLEGRTTSQGLISVVINQNCGALVEINCETDFVARNQKFHGLAETVATTVLDHATKLDTNELINKITLDGEALKNLLAPNGINLLDHVALAIGQVKENIQMRRALCINVQPDVKLFGCTHPTPMNPVPVSSGRYGAIIALKGNIENDTIGIQLCQHIIGMNPLKVGNAEIDEPHDDVEAEPCLLYQEFLLDPTISVQQLLNEAKVTIVDFKRYEMGEVLEEEKQKEEKEEEKESMQQSAETCN